MLKQKPAMAVGADRREFGRRSMVRHAWIVTGSRQRIACSILNVSAGGASLEFPVPTWLPVKFELTIEGTALTIRCDLRHRGEQGVGVSFVDVEKGRELFDLSAAQPGQTARAPATIDTDSVAPLRPRLSPDLIAKALRSPG